MGDEGRTKKKKKGKDAGEDVIFEVEESELEHVGLHDLNELKPTPLGKWKHFELLGNVSKCNVDKIQWGPKKDDEKRKINARDVPAYGELYGHCEPKKYGFGKKLKCGGCSGSLYRCNYCTAEKVLQKKKDKPGFKEFGKTTLDPDHELNKSRAA